MDIKRNIDIYSWRVGLNSPPRFRVPVRVTPLSGYSYCPIAPLPDSGVMQ